MRRVLILGAGLVTRPIVRHFLEREDVDLTVASLHLDDARGLVDGHPRGTAVAVDVTDPADLARLVPPSELVVSLVPYAYHVQVARLAIESRVNMITASYVSPEMRALDGEARDAGVTILNEIGLDPGLDHMAAVRMIERVRSDGGTVTSFDSCCGGLPSTEAADNPWKYKFSWSPRGALLAGRLPARYLANGQVVSIPGTDLFSHYWPYDVEGLGRFEMYPNRDSLPYIDLYDLRGVTDMRRGTIRYPGWCETMKVVADLGLLDIEPRKLPDGAVFADLTGAGLPPGPGSLVDRVASHVGLSAGHPAIMRMEWAGLFSDTPLPDHASTPLDMLAGRFQDLLVYAEGERDMVLQRHELLASWPDRPAERRVSLLVAYGESDGDSATSRTVSLPAAVAGDLMLEGTLRMPGVQIPVSSAIAEPVLDQLEALGIRFDESSHPAND